MSKVLEIRVALVWSMTNAAPDARKFDDALAHVQKKIKDIMEEELPLEDRYGVIIGHKLTSKDQLPWR